MNKPLKLLLLVAACGSGGAHAAYTQNGLSENGIAINGITINGIAINGITINGIATNALAPHGTQSCGHPVRMNGGSPDGLSSREHPMPLERRFVLMRDNLPPPPPPATGRDARMDCPGFSFHDLADRSLGR
jgi:hypothetical protein